MQYHKAFVRGSLAPFIVALLFVLTQFLSTCSGKPVGPPQTHPSVQLGPIGQFAEAVDSKSGRAGGPLCGIHALFGALRAEGYDADLAQLVSQEYVSSPRGSSMKDLVRAARDQGAFALPIRGANLITLQAAEQPMLLHVSVPGGTGEFVHWVLFLGMDGDAFRIADTPRPVQLYTSADLLAQWDGRAIVVSSAPISILRTQIAWIGGIMPQLIGSWVVLFLCAVGLSRRRSSYGSRQGPTRGTFFQCAVVLILGIFAAVLFHTTSASGFFGNRTAWASVITHFDQHHIEEISFGELVDAIDSNDASLVDARTTRAFGSGSLPGALSLPVNATLPERRSIVSTLDKEKLTIVFCQGQFCEYDTIVARELIAVGFSRVVIFPGGIEDWVQKRTLTPAQ